MKPRLHFLLLLSALMVGCGEESAELAEKQAQKQLEIREGETLSPEDLGIQKQQFLARPGKGEVAIFRSFFENEDYSHTYDQIYCPLDEPVITDLVIINRTFLTGEEPAPDQEGIPTRSWHIQADAFSHEVVEQHFKHSQFSWQSSWAELEVAGIDLVDEKSAAATGSLEYSKDWKGEIPGDRLRFSMFILPYEEAKKLHPELPDLEDGKGWTAAYPLDRQMKK